MLSERELRTLVDEAIVKYAVMNSGEKGWAKVDIEEGIKRCGGDKNDLYRAMVIGMEACFGDIIDPGSLLN